MKPIPYEPTAVNASPFLGPQMLSHLCNTDEFMYRVIHYPLVQLDIFEGLYSDKKSRPAHPPQIAFTLLWLKERDHLGRENMVNNLRFNQAWHLAMGTLYMGDSIPGSDKTTNRFQKDCEEYAKTKGTANPIDVIADRFSVMECALAGIDGSLLRSDSTPVSGAFTVRSREELLYLAILRGVESITCSDATEQVNDVRASDRLAKYEDPNFTLNRVSDRWPASQEKRREMLCQDADALLKVYHRDEDFRNHETVWEMVISQQTKIDDRGVRVFAEKGDDQLNSTIIQSLLDTDATYRWKNGKSLWGYVLNGIEAANDKAHFTISCCLYPNVTNDSDMANELNERIGPFFDRVDEVYAMYPALIKGDPRHCQAVVRTIIDAIKKDFVAEGRKLYEMSLSGASSEELTVQLRRQMATLDSFYGRLIAFDGNMILATDEEDSPGVGMPDTEKAEEQRDFCSKAVKDWDNYNAAPLDISDSAFAGLSDGERRNIILNKIANMEGFGSIGFLEARNCITDGAYSPSTEKARELGINLLTTNLLGKKGSPITYLFDLEGEEKTCPLGHRIEKTSVRGNGSICVWVNQDHCAGCPCSKDCGAKCQKRAGMATVIINPKVFPVIRSEAMILTDRYQKLADFRNGSEALMSLFHNFYKCDRWPIGMHNKRRRLKSMVMASNIRNLVLFINDKTRVHKNTTAYAA